MTPRDDLGRTVREAWVKWARTQPNPKPSWLVPYDDLCEADKEADRQIGEAVALAERERCEGICAAMAEQQRQYAIGAHGGKESQAAYHHAERIVNRCGDAIRSGS